ncbi:lysoplasmalogenase [Sphingorhabdus soli]|uniref:Lysoplasmalogenase n=1 Tax=Flavisphingopyxis soli TaxID=2601267 RepID=A0A5C6UA66_9SPHN|nr:lysoplasmalogenase [Sphingorhabdus soli]TXC69091.1 lysoplasmalogenase [Sphingorhabdus soli]
MEAHRPRLDALFFAAVFAGASYYAAVLLELQNPSAIVWKGAGVGLLALWAARHARSLDGWLIAGVLALGATGDVLIDAVNLRMGGIAFMIGHIVAVVLYLRNRRAAPSGSQALLGLVLLVGVPAIAYAVSPPGMQAVGHAIYGLTIGAMAGAAWTSRFSRYRVGIGAVLFALSDLLIFGRLGPLADSSLPHLLVWPLYFAGQALIAWGVVTRVSSERAAPS